MRRIRGWRKPGNAINVARPTKWGNPWRIKLEHNPRFATGRGAVVQHVVTGDVLGHVRADAAPYWAAEAYRRDIPDELIEAARAELRGRDLACWCPLDQPCHADVLLELANQGVSQ